MPASAADEIFRVSGVVFSRTSTRSLILGVPYTGIKSISFKHSRKGVIVPGQRTSGTPLGITDGLYMPESWEMETMVDTAEMIKQQLAVLPGNNGSYGNARFSYTLQIAEPNRAALPTLSFTLNGMKIEDDDFGLPDDAGALTWKFSGVFLSASSKGEGAGLSGLLSYLANVNAT
jgi:hypothetical protein